MGLRSLFHFAAPVCLSFWLMKVIVVTGSGGAAEAITGEVASVWEPSAVARRSFGSAMSSFAYEGEKGRLFVLWTAESGGTAAREVHVGIDLRRTVEEEDVLSLCEKLDGLCSAIWSSYDWRVPHTSGDDRRNQARPSWESLDRVRQDLRSPLNDRRLVFDPALPVIEKQARLLSEELDRFPQALREAVVTEVGVEIETLDRARRGDFTGQASQAVWRECYAVSTEALSRALETIENDVDEADVIDGLLKRVGGAATCFAATLWLIARADALGHLLNAAPDRLFRPYLKADWGLMPVTQLIAGVLDGTSLDLAVQQYADACRTPSQIRNASWIIPVDTSRPLWEPYMRIHRGFSMLHEIHGTASGADGPDFGAFDEEAFGDSVVRWREMSLEQLSRVVDELG